MRERNPGERRRSRMKHITEHKRYFTYIKHTRRTICSDQYLQLQISAEHKVEPNENFFAGRFSKHNLAPVGGLLSSLETGSFLI